MRHGELLRPHTSIGKREMVVYAVSRVSNSLSCIMAEECGVWMLQLQSLVVSVFEIPEQN
jgi:hypothetical protein